MKTFPLSLAALTMAIVSVTGCSDRNASADKQAGNAPVSASAPRTDEWLGKWTGPEGTYLELAGGHGKYDVTVQNLDGPRKFEGRYSDGGIAFERDGAREVIRATHGAETGMKWLADKKNCLTVRTGEGYCRD
ncbi:hypothetical protein CUPL110328_17390 [Cupriavidus plantarum]|uniref:Lipoprotein n=2 Tax=Cupriavidus plantarum TaxID=942865 RepID=A0A316ERZ0_9BURK|nr:hypothetical protein C7419_10362 [Cupriavidus plantarum]RLK33593.1 hypothetical protein C7417_4242 [Cupriavidus plantarum]CAG2148584.1 hypothetical protein LMG26296_04366 [Cupriavidus plantarum]SMR85309.1 hypothetical protein SAMN05421735_4111 [Cupriavidus plantarum]